MIDILEPYIPVVYYMAEAVGPTCEIVLHDVRKLENSIIAIANGHISERKIGDSATDLVLEILKDSSKYENDSITNYISKSNSGKTFRSSTYFIRDSLKEIIGMLCVNIDISEYMEIDRIIHNLMAIDPKKTSQSNSIYSEKNFPIHENLTSDIDGIIKLAIKRVLGEKPVQKKRMLIEEKKEVVKLLNEKGLFLMKGSITKVANYLGSSVPTLYRYISEISNKED